MGKNLESLKDLCQYLSVSCVPKFSASISPLKPWAWNLMVLLVSLLKNPFLSHTSGSRLLLKDMPSKNTVGKTHFEKFVEN